MAFLGTNDLAQHLPTIITEQYEPTCVENACYNLRLGNEAFVTDSKPNKKEFLDNKNPHVNIEPGQFALLITLEKVKIPEYYIGFISVRFQLKKRGLINVSGFHVDPGYEGKLIFSVYNAGPTMIRLEKAKPYFSMWLSELKSPSIYNGSFDKQDNIGIAYLDALNGNLPYTGTMLKKLSRLENRVKMIIWVGLIIISVLVSTVGILLSQNLKFSDGYDYRMREEIFQSIIDSVNKANKSKASMIRDSSIKSDK